MGDVAPKTNKKKDMYVRVVREQGKQQTSHSDKARRFTEVHSNNDVYNDKG